MRLRNLTALPIAFVLTAGLILTAWAWRAADWWRTRHLKRRERGARRTP